MAGRYLAVVSKIRRERLYKHKNALVSKRRRPAHKGSYILDAEGTPLHLRFAEERRDISANGARLDGMPNMNAAEKAVMEVFYDAKGVVSA